MEIEKMKKVAEHMSAENLKREIARAEKDLKEFLAEIKDLDIVSVVNNTNETMSYWVFLEKQKECSRLLAKIEIATEELARRETAFI